MAGVKAPHPPCPLCGSAVKRRAGEMANNYKARRYCSRKCEAEGRSLSAVASHPPKNPQCMGFSGQCFAPYEIKPGPSFGRVGLPATVLLRGTVLDGE